MTPLTDTAPEVERLMYEIYRQMSPARKMKIVADAYVSPEPTGLCVYEEG